MRSLSCYKIGKYWISLEHVAYLWKTSSLPWGGLSMIVTLMICIKIIKNKDLVVAHPHSGCSCTLFYNKLMGIWKTFDFFLG